MQILHSGEPEMTSKAMSHMMSLLEERRHDDKTFFIYLSLLQVKFLQYLKTFNHCIKCGESSSLLSATLHGVQKKASFIAINPSFDIVSI